MGDDSLSGPGEEAGDESSPVGSPQEPPIGAPPGPALAPSWPTPSAPPTTQPPAAPSTSERPTAYVWSPPTAETPAWDTLAPPARQEVSAGTGIASRGLGAGTEPPPAGGSQEARRAAEVPPAPREARRRAFVAAAATGAFVGALVAGLVVAAVKGDRPRSGAGIGFSASTSKAVRTGDVQDILSRIEPSVVSIRTRSLSLGDFLRPVPGEGAGTGFVVGADGIIVTNNHVVAGAQSIDVVLADERKLAARVLGRDSSTDLAVLKVDASGLPVAALGDSEQLRVGDDVIAIGNALALQGGPTVTRGIVSARNRTITGENGIRLEHLIQTDTAINPGNSGGPLVNSAGEVVGINTAVAGEAQNIGFSIAITPAKPIIDELRQGTTRIRPFLGVKMFTVTPAVAEQLGLKEESGALVVEVTPGSPAEVAGVRNGDVITSTAGKPVKRAEDVTSALNARKPGDQITIIIRRGDETKTIAVKVGQRPVDAD